MVVLFVSSGNSSTGISPIIKNQGDSLINRGVELTYFTIKGKGLKGYLKSIPRLKKHLKENKYDIIHAHYSLSAFVASFSGAKPLIVSLMGSDVKSKGYYRFIINLFNKFYWTKTIVKSEDMRVALQMKEAEVIPNGVDFNKFKPIDKDIALRETGWDVSKKGILFAANPNRPEKNFKLAKKTFDLLDDQEIELHSLDNVPNDKMPYYHNAADVVLITSLWEGSPNVIKEAMACNCPIISTDVGDVKEIIYGTDECYISNFNPNSLAKDIKRILSNNGKRSNGRRRIKHLDEELIALKLINLYKELLSNEK